MIKVHGRPCSTRKVCRVRHDRGHFEAREFDGCDWISIEQLWSVFGLFILGSYWLPGCRRAYLPASLIGFCRSIDIYLWRYFSDL